MKAFIVFCHPSEDSFTSYVRDAFIDGKSLMSENELSGLGVLKLIECKVLKDSYIRLRYEVIG